MKRYALGCAAVAVLLVLIVGMAGCGSYNRLVGSAQNVEATWAQVQNQYQRRFELIPNLVKTVEGAANFERSVLTDVTEARASVGKLQLSPGQSPGTAEELEKFEKAQGRLSSALSRLLVVAERYPELKATANFRDFQVQLEGTENRIAVERMRFNEAVQSYNTLIKRFPTLLVARVGGFQPKPYFQATTGSETAPKVEFNLGTPKPAPAK
jgi:LemA protein